MLTCADVVAVPTPPSPWTSSLTAPNGRRYLRRPQVEVIANVREVRLIEQQLNKATSP